MSTLTVAEIADINRRGWEYIVRDRPGHFPFVWVPDNALPLNKEFWPLLEDYCVAACCGISAYDLSHESVRSACVDPDADAADASRKDDAYRASIAEELLLLAGSLRAVEIRHVCVGWFNDIMSSAQYADFLEDVATKVTSPPEELS